jgi:hypothetical protein
MVEQCIQRFASEMIHWPNREQHVSDQPMGDSNLKGLYGAKTMEDFNTAIRDSQLGSQQSAQMNLATQYRKVRDALLEAQPFNESHLDPWWPIIILISNICKHSRQLEIFYDDARDRDELLIIVPFRGSRILSPSLFYDCFPSRTNSAILKTSELLYKQHKNKKWRDDKRYDLDSLQSALNDGISAEELRGINDCLDAVYDKNTIMKNYSVCELIRTALRGFRAIVLAIDESKTQTDEMLAVASQGGGSLRKYVGARIPTDRLNILRENCFHLCAERGDTEQLQVLVEDKEALRRALFQQDRKNKRTFLHHMYRMHFSDGLNKLLHDNVDAATLNEAMTLQDKDGKTPRQYCS